VGIDWMTALRRISFPAWEMNFSFHPLIRLHILPLMLLKEAILDLPIKAGRPRYLSKWIEGLRSASSRIIDLLVFLLGISAEKH
jgi:hypothetical protein